MTTRRHFIQALAAIAFVATTALPLPRASAAEGGPVVFAAASLKNALDAVNAAWTAKTGKSATVSYAASSALAKQIESGAPADLFVSADLDWMDALAKDKLIRAESRVELLGNSIVLVAPKGSVAPAAITPALPLAAMLGGGKLAMANVDSVPAGKYGKAALTHLGLWDAVKDQVAQAENVRAALVLVSRSEAPLGIVYKTDAAADPAVEVVGTFPEESHAPIVYPAALTAESQNADAGVFLDFLKTDEARKLFEAQGFTVLAKD
ncbi:MULTISPECIES: molybdate ABC transporter substrate-binding protein [unclassified Aureimonas]|uniref:molybdate ABC transporter substrate-binding protein n=1 Tax=unclassified Aureimonas TaxID=2615206 RepID=UPI0006FD358F|nr:MULTISPECIES: molybdate ABC transporter substrate-binding protein [unclassified Aureimonas]KQT65937.1 molybdenum ABC transporter substrate-binding protein [Aureimonas sp. Leaf427]KQT73296.1 molybdenum ABC transporter substrate-binding protein [Aureimonas sp. Leaf460]